METIVKEAYSNPDIGLSGAEALYKKLKKEHPSLSLKKVKEILSKVDGYQISQNVVRNFKTRRTLVLGIDQIWQADLAFMDVPTGAPAAQNDGVKYLLTVIDCFSKYAWVRPLMNKSGKDTADAFKTIFATGRTPEKIQVDRGTEFYNSTVQALLKEKGIGLYSSNSDHKAAIVERFNRTLKQKMARLFESRQTFRYIDKLQDLVKNYNKSYHSSIKMTPIEASEPKNEAKVFDNLYSESTIPKEAKFEVGDLVRIPSQKTIFSKEIVGKYTIEIFKIKEVQHTNPITYKIEDLQGEPIEGAYYEQELLKVPDSVLDEPFRIEKIEKTRGTGNKKEAFVKYLGLPSKFSDWIPYSNVGNSVKK